MSRQGGAQKKQPCRCDNYDFPHRVGSGICNRQEPYDPDEHGGMGSDELEWHNHIASMSTSQRSGWESARRMGVD